MEVITIYQLVYNNKSYLLLGKRNKMSHKDIHSFLFFGINFTEVMLCETNK